MVGGNVRTVPFLLLSDINYTDKHQPWNVYLKKNVIPLPGDGEEMDLFPYFVKKTSVLLEKILKESNSELDYPLWIRHDETGSPDETSGVSCTREICK